MKLDFLVWPYSRIFAWTNNRATGLRESFNRNIFLLFLNVLWSVEEKDREWRKSECFFKLIFYRMIFFVGIVVVVVNETQRSLLKRTKMKTTRLSYKYVFFKKSTLNWEMSGTKTKWAQYYSRIKTLPSYHRYLVF